MFHWIKRKFIQTKKLPVETKASMDDKLISTNLEDNLNYLKQLYRESSDVIFRPFSIGENQHIDAFLITIDGLYDKTIINEHVIKPLMSLKIDQYEKNQNYIKESLLSASAVSEEVSMNKSIELLMKGDSLLFIDGWNKVLVIEARFWEMRAIEEPITETAIRGPREAFSETLRTNTSMIRRKIHHPKLQMKHMVLGKLSQTDIAIAYIEGIASNEMLAEVEERLQKVNIDAILESGYIEELIEDNSFSLFPTIAHTERPDVVAARLLEGRVAIVVDGTPSVLVVPHLMLESFQTVDDFYSRPYYSSVMRILRFVSFFIATLLPAFYVATQNYHKELFPTDLLISVAAEREGVPFPLFMEVFLMTIVFELLKESGIRMPSPIGQAVAIVGGLVLGQSAVEAGIVGTPTVIVIATTAICTFVIPTLNDAIGILRLVFLVGASVIGVYGIMLIVSFLLLHLASLRSFGVPYMSPLFPIEWSGWKDMFVRFPLWSLNKRPQFVPIENRVRQGAEQKPEPSKSGDEAN